LSGAALDVFAAEPLAADHPFWRHPAIIVTPHIASEATPAAVARTLAATAAELVEGRPLTAAIDRRRGY
jgi:glyoxylate/hydroxypyruvate reductase A